MAREQLRRASEHLEAASDLADGDRVEQIDEQATQIATLATRERDPDHGRLDRHMNRLHEVASAAEGEVAERVTAAREAVSTYRETVEGV